MARVLLEDHLQEVTTFSGCLMLFEGQAEFFGNLFCPVKAVSGVTQCHGECKNVTWRNAIHANDVDLHQNEKDLYGYS